jgi:hypothetical protein
MKAPEPMLEARGTAKAAADLTAIGERGSDIRRVAEQIRTIYRHSNARRFASNGLGAWPALAASTVERKQAGGYDSRPMRRSGALEAALTSPSSSDQVDERDRSELRFGTTLPYAGYHDTGTGGEKRRELVELTPAERDQVTTLLGAYIAGAET